MQLVSSLKELRKIYDKNTIELSDPKFDSSIVKENSIVSLSIILNFKLRNSFRQNYLL